LARAGLRSCGLDVGPSHGDNIDCRLQVSVVDNIALAIPEGASAQYSRTQSHLADGSDDLVLIAAHAGLVRVGQNGHTVGTCAAQMVLVDMGVTGTVGHTEEDRFTTIRMPRRALLDINPRAEDKLSQVLSDGAVAETIFRYHALAANHGAASRRRRPAPDRAARGSISSACCSAPMRSMQASRAVADMRRPVSISCVPT
jgi:hypothetical protein